jgi:hypothetical protein
VCDAPLPTCPVVRPLPGDIAAPVRPFAAKRLTRSALVVSHYSDGLLRTQASGLLHPETGWSSRRFQVVPPPVVSRSQRLMVDSHSFPHARFTPSEEYPSPVAVPHHCGRCLLAVLSRRDRSEHRSVRLDPLCVPTSAAASASLSAEAVRARLPRRPCPSHPLPRVETLSRVCQIHPGSYARNALNLTDHPPPPKRLGRVRCTVFACSPEGALAGRFTRRRSA